MPNRIVHRRSSETATKAPPKRIVAGVVTLLGVSLCGCSLPGLGSGKLVNELRAENDRLLSEFRAERTRRESAEASLRQAESKLAESEKMLAQNLGPNSGRLSQVSGPFRDPTRLPSTLPTTGNAGFPSSLGGRSNRGNLQWQRRPQ